MSDVKLLEMGVQIRQFFAEKASECGVAVNPTVRDDRTTALTGRLYEENSGGRSFCIVEAEKRGRLEAFTKMTGLDFEIELLYVFTPLESKYFSALWDAYFQWIHDRIEAGPVLAKLDSYTE